MDQNEPNYSKWVQMDPIGSNWSQFGNSTSFRAQAKPSFEIAFLPSQAEPYLDILNPFGPKLSHAWILSLLLSLAQPPISNWWLNPGWYTLVCVYVFILCCTKHSFQAFNGIKEGFKAKVNSLYVDKTKLKSLGQFLIFTNSAPLGRVGLGVAMSMCLSVCLSVCAIKCSFQSIGPLGRCFL